MDKKILLNLLTNDELEQSAAQLLEYAEQSGYPELHRAAVQISGRLEDWRKAGVRNDLPPERITEMRNGIRASLLELVARRQSARPPARHAGKPL